MTRMRTVVAGLLSLLVVAVGGCQAYEAPDLGGIYNRAAQHHTPQRNPVIVIPGIMGSRLVERDTGRVIWGAFEGEYANPSDPEDARLIAAPMISESPIGELEDEIRAAGVLDRVEVDLFGLPVGQEAYVKLLAVLGVGGYRDLELGEAGAIDYGSDHYTCFQFPYDWRLDIAANARRLHEFIEEKRRYVRRQRAERFGVEESEVDFDLVAHSTGGLIARYYLRYGKAELAEDGPLPEITWAGAERVDRLILVGTPNAGSPEALLTLVEGKDFPLWLPNYSPALVGTFPSLYQLLPRPRHRMLRETGSGQPVHDLYDPAAWRRFGWGVVDPEQEEQLARLMPGIEDPARQRAIARDHLTRCLRRARRFHRALDQPAQPPPETRIHLFAGDAEPTPAELAVDPATGDGDLSVARTRPGDGTVPRYSALMDERLDGDWQPRLRSPIHWDGVHMLFTDHLGLTRSPMFTDNMLYLLLEAPRLERPDHEAAAQPLR